MFVPGDTFLFPRFVPGDTFLFPSFVPGDHILFPCFVPGDCFLFPTYSTVLPPPIWWPTTQLKKTLENGGKLFCLSLKIHVVPTWILKMLFTVAPPVRVAINSTTKIVRHYTRHICLSLKTHVVPTWVLKISIVGHTRHLESSNLVRMLTKTSLMYWNIKKQTKPN